MIAVVSDCPHCPGQPLEKIRFTARANCESCGCNFYLYKTSRKIQLEKFGKSCATGKEQYGPRLPKWTFDGKGKPTRI